MLLGWGVDKKTGMKTWIARNSFGANWGDKGDFYIRRGQNDFGIESEVSGYDLTLLL
jgi:C1A family cysteine protease